MLEVVIIICLAAALFLVLRHYPDAIEKKPSSGKSFFERIKAYFTEKKKKQLEKLQKQIIKPIVLPPEDNFKLPELTMQQKYRGLKPEIVRLLCDSEEAFDNNDLRESENKAIEVISLDKRCGEAYVIIGRVAFSRGEFDDAREAFKTALKCKEELAEAYFGLGQIDLREENYQDSIDNLLKAVSLDRGNPEWHALLGQVYNEIRQFAKAAKAYKKAAAIDIENREYKDLASEAEDKQRAHASVARMK